MSRAQPCVYASAESHSGSLHSPHGTKPHGLHVPRGRTSTWVGPNPEPIWLPTRSGCMPARNASVWNDGPLLASLWSRRRIPDSSVGPR